MKAGFRTDGGGAGLGLGHLMRCIAIAEAFKDQDVASCFVCKNFPAGIQLIEKYGYEVRPIPADSSAEEDLKKSEELLNDVDIIIADSHKFSSAYLIGLIQQKKIVAFLDDMMNQELPINVVIGNAYATRQAYGNLLSSNTTLLAGSEYLPLRKEFQRLSRRILTNSVNRILVTLGGEDAENITQLVVVALSGLDWNVTVDILLGVAYKHEEQLMKALSSYPHKYQIHKNITDVVELFFQTDIAITAAGSTVWELAACGTPMVVIQTAQNQDKLVGYLHKNKLGLVLGWYNSLSSSDIVRGLQSIENPQFRNMQSRKGQDLIDGFGAERISDALILAHTGMTNTQTITLRKIEANEEGNESRLIWEWRNDPITRQMSRTTDVISWENHKNWFSQAVIDPNKVILIGFLGSIPVGMVRFDYLSEDTAEININVNPSVRGKGLGGPLLTEACRYGFEVLNLSNIHAEIKQENTISIKIFKENNFAFQETKDGISIFNLKKK